MFRYLSVEIIVTALFIITKGENYNLFNKNEKSSRNSQLFHNLFLKKFGKRLLFRWYLPQNSRQPIQKQTTHNYYEDRF